MPLFPRDKFQIFNSVLLTDNYPNIAIVLSFDMAGFDDFALHFDFTNAASGTANKLSIRYDYSDIEAGPYRFGQEKVFGGGVITLKDLEMEYLQRAADLGVDSAIIDIPFADRFVKVRFKELVNSGGHGGIDAWIAYSVTNV